MVVHKESSMFYEKCCVLTMWKFIDFHVNQSLAINGNEQFVWVPPHEVFLRLSGSRVELFWLHFFLSAC